MKPIVVPERRAHSVMLDAIRASAALAVMFGHLRAFIFVGYQNLENPSLITKGFYYLTGFGHQAVIVFFVLSGYLVGGSVLNENPRTFWPRYAIKRLSRLWLVLLPCLVATLLLNALGKHTGGEAFLSGGLNPPVISAPPGPVHLDAFTFLGNLLFLQGIAVPTFGDNGPLWSLANEFWYYLLFPLLLFGLGRSYQSGWAKRTLLLSLAAVILYFIPDSMRLGFLTWLFGVLAYRVVSHASLSLARSPLIGIPFLMGYFFALHLSRRGGEGSDLAEGLLFACALPWLLSLEWNGKITSVFSWISKFSYTLYLSHFSMAAFLWCTFFGATSLEPGIAAVVRYVLICSLLIGYAFVLYLLFESRTDRVRRSLERLLLRPSLRAESDSPLKP